MSDFSSPPNPIRQTNPETSGAYKQRKANRTNAAKRDKKAKWDWEMFRMLYFGGMECSEIVTMDAFKGLSLLYAKNKVHEEGMSQKRKEIREKTLHSVGTTLAESAHEAIAVHEKWMREKMTAERRIIDQGPLLGGRTQTERLNNIAMIDGMTRKALGMDELKPLDNDQRQIGLLVMMQGEFAPRLKSANARPLPHEIEPKTTPPLCHPQMMDMEAFAGNVASKNGHDIQDQNEESDSGSSEFSPEGNEGLKVLPPLKVKDVKQSLVNENIPASELSPVAR